MDKNIIVERFYKDHKDHVYNFITRLVDEEQAIDICLQTFIKALSDKNVAQIANPKTYLFTIARNILYANIQTTNSSEEKHGNESEPKPESKKEDNVAVALKSKTENQEIPQQKSTELQKLQDKVKQAINRMSVKTKELMILRYTEDLSIKEISHITSRTISDVKVNLHRSKLRFESAFSDDKANNVSVSHESCDPLATLLAPHKNSDILEPHLQLIDKHISKCFLCTEDEEKIQHSKILFNIDTLITAPKIFDQKMNDAMASEYSFLAKIAKLPKKTATIKNISKKAAAKVTNVSTISSHLATKIGYGMVAGLASIIILFTLFSDDIEVADNDKNAAETDIDPFVNTDLSALVNFKAKNNTTGQYIKQNLSWEVYSTNHDELVESSTSENFDIGLTPGKYYVTAQYQGKTIKSPFEIKDDTSINIELNFNSSKQKLVALDVSTLPTLHIHRKTTDEHKSLQPKLNWDTCVENIELYIISKNSSPKQWRKREQEIRKKQPNFKLNRGISTEPDWGAITSNIEDEYFSGDQYALYKKGSSYKIINDGSCKLVQTDYHTAVIDDGKFKYYIDYINKTADKTISQLIIEKGVQAMNKMLESANKNQQTTNEKTKTNITLIAGTESVIGEPCEYTFNDDRSDIRHCYWKTMHQYPSYIKRNIILKTTKQLDNKQSFFGKAISVATLFEKNIDLSEKVFSVPSNITVTDTSIKDLKNLKNVLSVSR